MNDKERRGRKGTQWTNEEDLRVVELTLKGLNVPAAAKLMPDKSEFDIRKRIEMWNRKNVNLIEKGWDMAMAGRSF